MSVFSHRPRMGVAVGAAVLALIITATAPATAVLASVNLSPAVGPPTTATAVSGAGFLPLEGVAVSFDSAQVATAGAGPTGSFTTTLTVPASAAPGNHTVVARGRLSGLRAQAIFVVRTDWSQFRFDAARSGHNPYENVLGPANASRLAKAWSTPTRGPVRSSPVSVAGKVAVGSDDGALYILDPRSGRHVAFQTGGAIAGSPAGFEDPNLFVFGSADGFLYAVKPNGRLAWKAALGSPVTSSPLVANGKTPKKVVVGTEAGRVYAFTAQGTLLWSAQLDGAISSSPAGYHDPNLMGDPTQTVVVGTRAGSLYALSGSTGDVRWRTALDGPIAATPAIGRPNDFGGPTGYEDPNLFVGTTAGTLYKLSTAGGVMRWSLSLDGPISSSVAVGNPDIMPGIFVATETGTIARIADGAEPARVWSAGLGGPVRSSPALANGVLYVGSEAPAGSDFFALDAATGAVLLAVVLPGGVQSSPAVADGRVLVGSLGGDIVGFDAGV